MPRARGFDWDEAARLYESGLTQSEVAELLGVSNVSVHRALRRLGVATHEREAPSVRETTLRCVTCKEWKPDKSFSRPADPRHRRRRGRRGECRSCGTIARRSHRRRHRASENAYSSAYKRRRGHVRVSDCDESRHCRGCGVAYGGGSHYHRPSCPLRAELRAAA